jgi:hypothetical protein
MGLARHQGQYEHADHEFKNNFLIPTILGCDMPRGKKKGRKKKLYEKMCMAMGGIEPKGFGLFPQLGRG